MKKIFIKSPDANNNIDPTIRDRMLNHIPNLTNNIQSADVVLIPISWIHNYIFDEHLKSISKPIIIVDYMEYGSSWDHESKKATHFFGKNTRDFQNLQNPEWHKFCDWVRSKNLIGYFKRELLAEDASATVMPVEFTCYTDLKPVQAPEQFNTRPLEVFYCWGFSNCSRPRLHGEIFKQMCPRNYGIISEFSHFQGYFNGSRGNTWATIFSPHYTRVHISKIIEHQTQSKMSVSLWGNGVKCFRSAECIDTIMVLPYDNLKWTYEWVHGVNCIRVNNGNEFEEIFEATKREDLYQIYLNSQITLEKYKSSNYAKNYVYETINKL